MTAKSNVFTQLRIVTLTAVFAWTLAQVNLVFGTDPLTGLVGLADLTQEERDWLADHPTIRVAPDPDFPPIELFDENGQYQGIAADYLALIEEKLGIKFEILHPETWDEALLLAKNREADVLAAAMNSPQRSEYMLFTDAHIRLPGVILVRTGIEEKMTLKKLAGMKVAVVSGYVWQDLIANDHPDIDLHLVPDIRTGLRKVSFGMVDVMVGDPATSTYYIERDGITNLKIGGQSAYRYELAIASRKDWPQLNSILDKVLNNITLEEKRAITHRWINLKDESSGVAERIWRFSLVGFSVGGVIVLGIWLWNRVLARQVSDRTKELNNELAQRIRAEQSLSDFNKTLDQRVKDRTEELERSNKELDDFAYVASHDLRSPLEGVYKLARWVYDDNADILSDESKQHLEQMQRRICRLRNLLDDLLRYSRAGRPDHKTLSVDTGQLTRDIVDLANRPETFTVSVAPDMPTLVTAKTPLEQILRNLISNAIKHHSRHDGHVNVSCKTNGRFVEFEIRDDGPGIEPQYHDRIFNMFTTLRPRDEVEGSGMGLAIIKKLVERYGGKITVASDSGEGTTFRFTWPKTMNGHS